MATVVQLLILGSGYISLPLVTMAKILGYEVTVIDDRPSTAVTRFNAAHSIVCADFERALDAINISPQTFVVILTKDAVYDGRRRIRRKGFRCPLCFR